MKRTISIAYGDEASQQRHWKSRRLTDKLLDSYTFGVLIADARAKWRTRYDIVMDELKYPALYKEFLLETQGDELDLNCYYESVDSNEVDQDIIDFFRDIGAACDPIEILD